MPVHYQCGWLKSDATWEGAGVVSNSLHNSSPSIKKDPPKLHPSETGSSVLFWSPQGRDTHMTNIHTSMQNVHTIKNNLKKGKEKETSSTFLSTIERSLGQYGPWMSSFKGSTVSLNSVFLTNLYYCFALIKVVLGLERWLITSLYSSPRGSADPGLHPHPHSHAHTHTLRYAYTSFKNSKKGEFSWKKIKLPCYFAIISFH